MAQAEALPLLWFGFASFVAVLASLSTGAPMTGLFDPETGEVTDPDGCPNCLAARKEQIEAESDLRAAERELRRVRREVSGLRAELTRQRSDSPEGYRAKALFRYWVARCGKSERNVFGEKRMKVVLARLKEHDAQYIARAIDGAAVGAFTGDNGTTYDDLELICRDEVHLERFYELAESRGAKTLVGPAWIKEFDGTNLEPAQNDAPF
jgi:hypothetical protein